MQEYEYAPKSKKTKEKWLLAVFLCLAALLYATSRIPNIPVPFLFQLFAVFALVAVVMIITRSLMRNYIYCIAKRDDGEETDVPDLVITEIYGRRTTVVCRIELSCIMSVTPVTAENRRSVADMQKGKRVYRYTDEIFPDRLYVLTVTREEESFLLFITADEKLVSLLMQR